MEKLPTSKFEEDEEIKEEIISDNNGEDLDLEGDVEEKEFAIESKGSGNYDDDYFDMVVGHMQDIVFDPKFTEIQNKFFVDHCQEFDATEENKIIYTEIFHKYKQSIEVYIEKKLAEKIKGFKMATFLKLLEKRAGQIDDQLADTLLSFTDFLLFKQLILEHKPAPKKPEGELSISGVKARFHEEEQSDGEERPDLTLDIKPYPKKKQ
eukprot:TRINITY_DN134993_c2_g1_i1.p3 TRINITY_DN134993_c2_g1~~TRINITY_DN134993_c2_g1_i1.p3  ORF type:complete len:208 (+),score=55.41 TRINITY_DN134993_c2_g1_i1:2017-2640(+)